MNKNVDYIIVGQGLAGSFLALQLIKLGKSFIVVDKGHKNSSSYIAAGVLNPLVLKRYTKTWRADEFLEYNPTFFKSIEKLLGKNYFHPLPIEKLISSEDEETFWEHRYEKDQLSAYLEEDLTLLDKKYTTPVSYKVGQVKQTAWLNISQLLIDFRDYIKRKDLLLEIPFDYEQLNNKHSFNGIKYKKIIFCEGAAVIENPYFNSLPLSLNKGQLITIKSNALPESSMLKKKVFVLPIGKNEFKVGATYAWEWDNEEVDPEKTDLLETQLKEMLSIDYKIIKESAGIRPTLKDRRPILGEHPTQKGLYIFNGMGSKGCFMAPLLAKELLEYIENGISLSPETRIDRYREELSN